MAQGRTHYDVLGLSRDASPEDIEANYRLKLSQLKARAGVVPAEVMALRTAHQALADPARRAAYDKSLAPPARVREAFVATPPKAPELERSFWQSTPVMLAGLVVLAGLGAWGWSNWQKKRPPPAPQRMAVPAAPAKQPPRKPPAGAVPAPAAPAATPAPRPPAPATRK